MVSRSIYYHLCPGWSTCATPLITACTTKDSKRQKTATVYFTCKQLPWLLPFGFERQYRYRTVCEKNVLAWNHIFIVKANFKPMKFHGN